MKKSTIIIGASILALAIYTSKKVNNLNTLVNSLEISLKKIQNIKFIGNKVIITVSVMLKNTTNHSFSFSTGSLLSLKKIILYREDGTKLAEASTNISGVKIAPMGETIINNIDIEGDIIEALHEYLTTEFKGNYKTKAVLSTLGKQWMVS